jgi:hypothetical protein
VLAPAVRGTAGAYTAEYRRALLAARQAERLAGYIDRAALLVEADDARTDR